MRSLRLKFSFLRSLSPSSYSRIVLPPAEPPPPPAEPQSEALPPTLLEPNESDLAPPGMSDPGPQDTGVRGRERASPPPPPRLMDTVSQSEVR